MESDQARITAIGIDTGGTFTDLVAWIGGRLQVRKVLSSPHDPGAAVRAALGELAGSGAPVVHGTTVATNALLERRGARVALVTTSGFEDVLEIGRQGRPDPYALEPRRPAALVPRPLRFGVSGPLRPGGGGSDPAPEATELAELRARLAAAGVESVAIALLFSYLDASAEDRVAAALRGGEANGGGAAADDGIADGRGHKGAAGGGAPWAITQSSRVRPVFREYERTSTTVANAYVAPRMSGYLRGLAARASGVRWRVMASSAGSLDLEAAARLPAACLLSGPAGGVLGAARVAAALGIESFLTLDMGGTSTDVCLVEGEIPTSDASVVAGLPIAFPSVDIHTVGAGGGSIVRRDGAGVLRVGPESAGADPGPIVYGGGGVRPTVTDANVLLGRLPAATFVRLGGGDAAARVGEVEAAFAELAQPLGATPVEAAAAALAAVEASMARALRVISTRRGRDPRGAALICFGGAGPLHGVALAAALGIERVVVPPVPGVLSALGLAGADARRDYVRAVLQPVGARLDRATVETLLAPLREAALADARGDERAAARAAGGGRRDAAPPQAPEPRLVASADLRYRGQSHEIEVPLAGDVVERFHREHQRRFGHANRGRPLELVHLRLRSVVPGPRLGIGPLAADAAPAGVSPDGASPGTWPAIVARGALRAGATISGPAVCVEDTATTWLPAGWQARAVECGALIITRGIARDEEHAAHPEERS